MAVFSTNLIIYKHTDFEQTFVLEDSQTNSFKDLTDFTGTCKMQRTLNLGSLTSFTLAFTNRIRGKIRISLTDEVHEENLEQIKLELSKTIENIEETKCESNVLETASSNGKSSKNQNHNKINQFTETPKLPLPYIKNLRKWINNDKKAS